MTMRYLAVLMWASVCLAQTFEVVSVKVSTDPPGSSGTHATEGSIRMSNVTARQCVQSAYGLKDFQVIGGPKWMDDDRFNIDAKTGGAVKGAELMAMMQAMLADRFQLKLHHEQRPFPGFALAAVKGGLKMQPDESEGGEGSNTNSRDGQGTMEVQRGTMAGLARTLSMLLRTQVVDATGIAGKFSFKIQ